MKKIILAMLAIFTLSTGTAFSSADIAGKYEYKDRKGEYGGTITIQQATNNEYDVVIHSFTSTRQDGSTYTWCATLIGRGRVIDGVLVVKNTAKEIGADKSQDVFTRIYLNKHHDIEKFIEENKNNKKNAKFAKELSAMSASQIAIVQIAEPINHGGYEVSGKEECDRGGGIDVGIFTKSGVRQAGTKATATGKQNQREAEAKKQTKSALEAAGVIALSPNTMNWKDARAYCESKGGRFPRVIGRKDWNGDGRGSAALEVFGAVGKPWPSWLPSDTPYWTGTRSTKGPDLQWDVRNNGGRVDVGSNSRNRSYRVICIR